MSGLSSCGFLLIHVSCYWPGPTPHRSPGRHPPVWALDCDQASASGSGAAADTGAVNKTPSSNIQHLVFSVSDGSYGKDILLRVGDVGKTMLYNRSFEIGWNYWCSIQTYFCNFLFERKACGPRTVTVASTFGLCLMFWTFDDVASNFRIMIKRALELNVEHIGTNNRHQTR